MKKVRISQENEIFEKYWYYSLSSDVFLGLFMGASSALNIQAAYELAKKLGKGNTVVTVICDGGILSQFSRDLFHILQHIDTSPGYSANNGSSRRIFWMQFQKNGKQD